MTAIALFGAGGKMGFRLSQNLKGSRFDVRHVEVSEAGQQKLKSELGISCASPKRRWMAPRQPSWRCRIH